jgi:hypothetical protein
MSNKNFFLLTIHALEYIVLIVRFCHLSSKNQTNITNLSEHVGRGTGRGGMKRIREDYVEGESWGRGFKGSGSPDGLNYV